MPESHNALIEAVARANPNTVVVLQLGAPVTLPWASRVKGILLLYLGGQAVGGAVADLLSGAAAPGGKLVETWPLALADNPSYRYFPGGTKSVEYRESVFVGYRYYNTVDKRVAYPFGYGLSYTTFEYSALKLSKDSFKAGEEMQVTFTVKNTGKRAGAEIAQVYVAPDASKIFRPKAELRGFEKILLESGEAKTVTVSLDTRSFAYYNALNAAWAVEGGVYAVLVGADSRDIRLRGSVTVTGDGRETVLATLREKAPEYFALKKDGFVVSDASLTALYGRPLPPSERQPGDPFTLNSTMFDIKDTQIGQGLLAQLKQGFAEAFGAGSGPDDMSRIIERMMLDMPLRTLSMLSQGQLPPQAIDGIVDVLNGKPDPIIEGMFGGK
jgi:beta-glucosidase